MFKKGRGNDISMNNAKKFIFSHLRLLYNIKIKGSWQ